jgi:hypothetical protein
MISFKARSRKQGRTNLMGKGGDRQTSDSDGDDLVDVCFPSKSLVLAPFFYVDILPSLLASRRCTGLGRGLLLGRSGRGSERVQIANRAYTLDLSRRLRSARCEANCIGSLPKRRPNSTDDQRIFPDLRVWTKNPKKSRRPRFSMRRLPGFCTVCLFFPLSAPATVFLFAIVLVFSPVRSRRLPALLALPSTRHRATSLPFFRARQASAAQIEPCRRLLMNQQSRSHPAAAPAALHRSHSHSPSRTPASACYYSNNHCF